MAFERKFNIGDKVIILEGSCTGTEGVITAYATGCGYPYRVTFAGGVYYWYRASQLKKASDGSDSVNPAKLTKGMKVRIRKDADCFQTVFPYMREHCGTVVTIKSVNGSSVLVEENIYSWVKENILPVEPSWVRGTSAAKFKKGMLVRVREDIGQVPSVNPGIVPEMVKMAGQIYTVKEHDGFGKYIVLGEDRASYSWRPEWLELKVDPSEDTVKETATTEDPKKWVVGSDLKQFRKGMQVRVRKDIDSVEKVDNCYIVLDMVDLAGAELTVVSVDTRVHLNNPGHQWAWMPSYLEIPASEATITVVKEPEWVNVVAGTELFCGQEVRIRPDLCMEDEILGSGLVGEMIDLAGKICTINYIDVDGDVALNAPGNGYYWHPSYLQVRSSVASKADPTAEISEVAVSSCSESTTLKAVERDECIDSIRCWGVIDEDYDTCIVTEHRRAEEVVDSVISAKISSKVPLPKFHKVISLGKKFSI